MGTSLGELLDTARRARFVGRRQEVASFDDALAGRTPRRVLFVHGQGGIGKTTLLAEFRARARKAGRRVVDVDGREVDPSPEGMTTAIHDNDDAAVLLIDGYEQLRPVDGWLRDEFLPRLSADSVVVLAGRDAPPAPWRADAGWRQLVAVHRLGHLDDVDSGQLLAQAGVDAGVRDHLVRLGQGHPLTLALLADLAAADQVPDALADAPDLISALLESFLHDVPGDAHLTGLATCAIAWLTTEDLLARMVGADAPRVWGWLAARPFVARGPRGLFVHDLARDVLDAEFERRMPERYHDHRRAIHAHTVTGLRATSGPDRQRHAQQLLFLQRNSPYAAAFSALRAVGSAAVVPARADDHDEVCRIVERFEGPDSADLTRAWLREQPDRLYVVRTPGGVAGFALHLFCPSGSPLEQQDPAVRAVLDHVARHGPTRPGELVNIIRVIAGAGEYQRDPYAVLAGPVSGVIEWLTRPLAWSFGITVDPEFWAPRFAHVAFAPLAEADVGGRRHVAFGIDWRRLPVDVWLDLTRERGHTGETGPPPAALLRPPPLGRDAFAAAVKAALPVLHRPDRLGASPLMGSALATTATGPTAARLRATIEAAVACLAGEAKGEQLRAVLDRTYLRPAPTQEAAAQVLDLPLSTYRRYLARALERLTDLLWSVEIGDTRLP
ncbi:AAA family ATPase [Asanoa sp. WMMD1127]|uniref:AAA family ATPase n=1 Tax=Asanoa sp. WMMD1127 TaxID=3016107 RepID=UPI0024174A9C|nr:AAA family ATPase [Asanoa sp. WMMD1127]MDG4820274.1 AAA family ATPase [Asanoa sp. WMMD1127]